MDYKRKISTDIESIREKYEAIIHDKDDRSEIKKLNLNKKSLAHLE